MRVKQLAKRNDIPIKMLQEELEIGKTSLSKWNKGTKIPRIDKFIKLADYFNVSVDYLLCRTNQEEMYVSNYSPATYRIIRELESMTLEDKDIEVIAGFLKVFGAYLQK